MKNFYLLFVVTLLIVSCNLKQKDNSSNKDSLTVQSKPKEELKTLNEIKLVLLDARCEKAELLLGKADKKGMILSDLSGDTYYMVYFNKVLDGNAVKHLLIIIDTEEYESISDDSKITDVKAISEGEIKYIDRGVTLTVSRSGLKSNGRYFTVGNGTANWWDIK